MLDIITGQLRTCWEILLDIANMLDNIIWQLEDRRNSDLISNTKSRSRFHMSSSDNQGMLRKVTTVVPVLKLSSLSLILMPQQTTLLISKLLSYLEPDIEWV